MTKGEKRIKSRMQTNTLMIIVVVVVVVPALVVVVLRRLTSITQNKLDSLCPLQVTPSPPPAPANHIQIRIQNPNQNQNQNENQSHWLFINCQLFFLLPPAFIVVVYVSNFLWFIMLSVKSAEQNNKCFLQILSSYFSVLKTSSTLI